MDIIQAIKHPKVFEPFMGDDLSSWKSWLVALRVLYGLPVQSKFGRNLIKQCTGRDPDKLPKAGFQTALFLTGRRSGKSRIAAVIGAYAATLAGAESRLQKGEQGIVPVISPSKRQSDVVKKYLRAIFDTPVLRKEITSDRKDSGFTLKSGNQVETLSADWRKCRGMTLLACVLDEICFFATEQETRVRSDTEVVRAIQPALATTQGRLIAISSPYAKRGWTYNQYKKHFGNNKSPVLVWNAPSRVMNPTLPQAVVDAAMAEDMAAAKSEYLAEFRDDISAFLSIEVIENLVVKDRRENTPNSDLRYYAFADLSGGRNDSAALAVAHRVKRKVILDALKVWRAPHNPHAVIANMADVLRHWGLNRVIGDNYAGEFAASAFQSNGIQYRKCEKNKSQLYAELLPVLCAGEIELLDDELLVKQLAGLERRVRSGGKDIIDHPLHGHDDAANALAGVAVTAARPIKIVGAGGY